MEVCFSVSACQCLLSDFNSRCLVPLMILHVEIVISVMSKIELVFLHVLTGHCVQSLASFLLSSYACFKFVLKFFITFVWGSGVSSCATCTSGSQRTALFVGSSSAFVWVLRMEVRSSGCSIEPSHGAVLASRVQG